YACPGQRVVCDDKGAVLVDCWKKDGSIPKPTVAKWGPGCQISDDATCAINASTTNGDGNTSKPADKSKYPGPGFKMPRPDAIPHSYLPHQDPIKRCGWE